MVSLEVTAVSIDAVKRIHMHAVHLERLVQWSIMDCKGLVPGMRGGTIIELEGPYTPIAAKQLRETVLYLRRARDSGLIKKAFGRVRERVTIARRFATSFHGITAELADEVLENCNPYRRLLSGPRCGLWATRMATRVQPNHVFRARTAFQQLTRIGADPYFPGLRDLIVQEYEDVRAGRFGEVAIEPLTAREVVERTVVQWHPDGKRKGHVLVTTPGQAAYQVEVGNVRKVMEAIDRVAHQAQRALRDDARKHGRDHRPGPIPALPVIMSQVQKTRLLGLFQRILPVLKLERGDVFSDRRAAKQDDLGDVKVRFQVLPSETRETDFHEQCDLVKKSDLEDGDPDDFDPGETSD